MRLQLELWLQHAGRSRSLARLRSLRVEIGEAGQQIAVDTTKLLALTAKLHKIEPDLPCQARYYQAGAMGVGHGRRLR